MTLLCRKHKLEGECVSLQAVGALKKLIRSDGRCWTVTEIHLSTEAID